MQRFDHPAQPMNPYPDAPVEIAAFRYDSALFLVRLKDAVKLRTGEDADYLTARPYAVSWRPKDGEWRQIIVPEGLITDLTSVPRWLRWFVGRVGPWLEAAIVHDYLYLAWQDVPGRTPTEQNRTFADDIMFAAMKEADVRWWVARLIYWAVSTFGQKPYERRKEDRYIDLSDLDVVKRTPLRIPRV